MDAYVGITTDMAYRLDRHIENSWDDLADLVLSTDPLFVGSDGTLTDVPFFFDRDRARSIEKAMIKELADTGWNVLNKLDNPQYDHRRRDWDWPDCPKEYLQHVADLIDRR